MHFTKADCGLPLSIDETRKRLLEMLDALSSYCESQNLRYYLSGGTLLGAVRHGGFIPWDDDIDINIPRPDIEILFKRTGGNLGRYILTRGGEDPFSRGCQLFRLYDPEVIIENHGGGYLKEPFYHPLFMDIFSIEGYPDNEWITRLFCLKLSVLNRMLRISQFRLFSEIKFHAQVKYLLLYPFARMIGFKRWSKWFQREISRYPFDTSKVVGVTSTIRNFPHEHLKKEDYIPFVRVTFEGRVFYTFKNYKIYLSRLYGDYMKLPPPEKRVSHHTLKAYERVPLRGNC